MAGEESSDVCSVCACGWGCGEAVHEGREHSERDGLCDGRVASEACEESEC